MLNLRTDGNVDTESNKQYNVLKTVFLVDILKVVDEKSRIRIRISILIPGYGSKDLDPSQNVTDPEHCCKVRFHVKFSNLKHRIKFLSFYPGLDCNTLGSVLLPLIPGTVPVPHFVLNIVV